jgi:hypothetical protein
MFILVRVGFQLQQYSTYTTVLELQKYWPWCNFQSYYMYHTHVNHVTFEGQSSKWHHCWHVSLLLDLEHSNIV